MRTICPRLILDLLTAYNLIDDDSQVMRVTSGWDDAIVPGTVRVTIEPAMVIAYAKV
jgi:hypothetical protein